MTGRAASAIEWGWMARTAFAVGRHPGLWATALRQISVLAVPGWWRRSPHLPLPDPAYLRFRSQTMYGDAARQPDPADVVTYLQWCRAWPHLTRSAS